MNSVQAFSEGMQTALESKEPRKFFEDTKDNGVLEKYFPELYKLFGIPQNKKHHPEVDTGIHSLMSLDIATELSNSPQVRFAALCHDLGKGITDKALWPSHNNHEILGSYVVASVCERFDLDPYYKALATVASEYHLNVHKADRLRPDVIYKMMLSISGFNDHEKFYDFLTVCEADIRGRLGMKHIKATGVELTRSMYDRASVVEDVANVIEELIENTDNIVDGDKIKNTLANIRSEAIKKARHDYLDIV